MNKQQLLKSLERFGFTKAQSKLYLAGLTKGKVLMKPLAKEANVKRTTAIYIIKELLRREFFSTIKIGKRTGYLAASPKQLLEMTKKRERLVKNLIPHLEKILKTSH